MFACPLFREFCELYNTAKLNGTNIDAVPTFNWRHSWVGIVRAEFAKTKGAEIVLHAKLSTFRAAKLKGFTIFCLVMVMLFSDMSCYPWLSR